jgi:hypothetical protein
VEPALEILNKQYRDFDFIRKDCATITEFEFFVSKWPQSRYSRYPILYLAFHGEPGQIVLSDGKRSIEDIASKLSGVCSNKIIIFSSCSTLDIDDTRLSEFLNTTGAIAVLGYKSDIDWIRSVALDLLLIETLQEYEFSGRGLRGIIPQVEKLSEQFSDLELSLHKGTQRIRLDCESEANHNLNRLLDKPG